MAPIPELTRVAGMTILHDNLYTKRAVSNPPLHNPYLIRCVARRGLLWLKGKPPQKLKEKKQQRVL